MTVIPKKIHYCWLGPAPKPESVLYCIKSWEKYCPDYEIIEWNEKNYDFTKNPYMKQAYESKKWGFVPDYARLDIVYQHGGIYLDTDVEIIKSFDELLNQEAFIGFEETGIGEYFVNCGQGFGAIPGNSVIKAARDLYDNLTFEDENGNLNMIASPHYTTQTLRRFGLIQKNELQQLEGITVYSTDVLCPKNFTTGKINITDRTVSIHHFTASWLDEKIKKELEHQKNIKNRYGKQLGSRILYLESVVSKYGTRDMIANVPERIVCKIKGRIVSAIEIYPYYKNIILAKRTNPGVDLPIILDTAICSDNLGDQIIMENCLKHISEFQHEMRYEHIPTHIPTSSQNLKKLLNANIKILCGTNALSGHMRTYGLWKIDSNIAPYKNTVLMGVGMASYDMDYDRYTKMLFHTILSKSYIHSVRDSATEKMLKSMGIKNVINTGCPTMWDLTLEHCKLIPLHKGKQVICTVTDYSRDREQDKSMLDILLKNYSKVFLWLQGEHDLAYIRELGYEDKLELVGDSLEEYDNILELKDLDYVGTRLHAGIRAIAAGHRSLIISIDNRASSISEDTGLPIIQRKDIKLYLHDKINMQFETKIILKQKNIDIWKKQFVVAGKKMFNGDQP